MALFAYSFPFEGVGDVHHAEVERQDLAGVDDVDLEQKEDVMNERRECYNVSFICLLPLNGEVTVTSTIYFNNNVGI